MNVEEVAEKLKQVKDYHNRPQSSNETYLYNARIFIRLIKKAKTKNFYYDYNKTMSLFNDYSITTKITYLQILLQLLEYDKLFNKKNTDVISSKFKIELDKLRTIKDSNAYNNVASNPKKEKVLATTIDDVKNVIKKMEKDGFILEGLILSILLEFPCRLEIATLKYKTNKNISDVDNNNYFIFSPTITSPFKDNKPIISRGSYKTAKTYGRIEVPIKLDIANKIIEYIKYNKINENDYLFKKYSNNQKLAKRLHFITRKYNNDIPISTNIICKLATSNIDVNEFDNAFNTIQHIGKIRGTSVKTLINNYIIRSKDK